MNWTEQVDAYCERLGPGLLAEPLNAISNLAFVIAAMWVWPRLKGDAGAQLLCLVLGLIGVASGLFHTLANAWSGAADSLSILIYILIYVFLAGGRVLGVGRVASVALVLAFFPFTAATAYIIGAVFGSLNGSVAYIPVAILIVIFGVISSDRRIGNGLFIGAGVLTISLTARTIDETICAAVPIGTHFIWHILNAIMLAWMIIVIHRASLAGTRARG